MDIQEYRVRQPFEVFFWALLKIGARLLAALYKTT
jgi:hypothetical protein